MGLKSVRLLIRQGHVVHDMNRLPIHLEASSELALGEIPPIDQYSEKM